jgi:shikimate dehydrogenase
MQEISGSTRVCFVVADPVHQVRTPQAQNTMWAERGVDLVTVPARVTTQGLPGFIVGLRANASAAGAVITVPHKQNVVALCDGLGPNAKIVGAVNVIRRGDDGRLTGETFDGLGFIAGLRGQGADPAGMPVVVLGAGGAASAIAVALLDAGVTALDIVNRTPARAEELRARLTQAFPQADVGTGVGRIGTAALVVNATSSGMQPDDVSPIDASLLAAHAIAADVVMAAQPTPFLAAAAGHGIRTHEGRHMLAGQLELISDYLVG